MGVDPEPDRTTPEPPRRRAGRVSSFLGWVLIVLAVAAIVVGVVAAVSRQVG